MAGDALSVALLTFLLLVAILLKVLIDILMTMNIRIKPNILLIYTP